MRGKHLLVTGGAGSFGQAFIAELLDGNHAPGLVTVFSRDERKQYELANELARHSARVRFVIGDMRDAARVDEVMAGADLVVHAAAMKHVPAAEANPYECIRTNVEGARNLTLAANRHGVERVVALSTDKAVSPSTVYGASKMAMERILMQADSRGRTRFTVVRYANVFASGGSVVPFFLSQRAKGVLPITDPDMTRFSITMREGIDLVLHALDVSRGGEIIVPVAHSYRVGDVAMAIAPDAEHRIVGPRAGEKMHESMFSLNEAPFVARHGNYYVIAPQSGRWNIADYCKEEAEAQPLAQPFEYQSGDNTDWLSVADIRALVRNELGVDL